MRGLPFPGLLSVQAAALYLPLLAAGLALSEVIWQAVRRFGPAASEPGDVRDAAFLIVFGSTAVMLFLNGAVRVQALHMLLGIVPALIVLLPASRRVRRCRNLAGKRGNANRHRTNR